MPLNIWLTDRSRYEEGMGHCQRARYLSYHAGPHGYGWQRKAQSIPTVTGQLVHSPLAEILEEVKRTDAIPDDAFVYVCITRAIRQYEQIVTTRGLRLVTDEADLALRTAEQTTLLEGLVWAWVKTQLPPWLAEWRPVLVEAEYVSVVACTCGLGNRIGTAEDHDARACDGIGWMTRADVVGEHRLTSSLSYHEFKTTGDASMSWEATWPHRIQLMAGILGAEDLLGRPIDQIYIHGLVKGRRLSEYNPELRNYSGPRYQQTPLCYGYRRPANPPLMDEAWAVSFSYVDELGKNRKLTKDYERTGIWELPKELWWGNGGSLSASHYWTMWIGATLSKSVRVIGPLDRKDWKLDQFLVQMAAEESRWRDRLWAIYELSQGGASWGSDVLQAYLDLQVPQARGEACQSYFGDTCPFLPLCDRHDGWQDPALIGYVARRPHHGPELEVAIARGLIAAEVGAGEMPEEE